ncbi:MAG: hypothetical protein ABIF77_00290 [bacterium]
MGRFRQTGNGHTAISVDAQPNQDPVVYFAEDGVARWGIRTDASVAHQFQVRVHREGGTWPRVMVIDTLGNVGIGAPEPDTRLDVNGQIKISGGSPGNGKLLASDSNGLAHWQEVGTEYMISPRHASSVFSPSGLDIDFLYTHVVIASTSSTTNFVDFPLDIPARVMGAQQKLQGITIHYTVADYVNQYITNTVIFMSNNTGGAGTVYTDNTPRNSRTWTSYTVTLTTPVTITGTLTLHLKLHFSDLGSPYTISIGSIMVTTTD